MVEVGDPQTPFWQVSPPVHAVPSSQVLPFDLFGLVQTPLAGSQVPAM